MRKTIKLFVVLVLCWGIFVAVEGNRLIGSENPGKYPILYIGGTHIAGERAEYLSLGFSQIYYLDKNDSFEYGEFCVLGLKVSRWDK